MSELNPSIIPLDKGLNLQTPKLTAPSGSLLDSLNYEHVDFQGQKRIDGFESYIGKLFTEYVNIYSVDGSFNPFSFPNAGVVYNETTNEFIGIWTVIFDEVTSTTNSYILSYKDIDSIPIGEVEMYEPNNGGQITTQEITSVVKLGPENWNEHVPSDVESYYELQLALKNAARSEVARTQELPGAVIGLHWHDDRLYAVADMSRVTLTDSLPMNTVYRLNDPNIGPLVYVVESDTNIASLLTAIPVEEGDFLYEDGEEFEAAAISQVTGQKYATLYQARSPEQALEETGDITRMGWEALHLGWVVPFEDGRSMFGELFALNQNRQDLGVQGPTDTSADNGRPLRLKQDFPIANGQEQVNGWKSINTPTSFNLDPLNVRDTSDGLFIYGDAFFSWSSDSTSISAPGITTPTLESNAATNTTDIEL